MAAGTVLEPDEIELSGGVDFTPDQLRRMADKAVRDAVFAERWEKALAMPHKLGLRALRRLARDYNLKPPQGGRR